MQIIEARKVFLVSGAAVKRRNDSRSCGQGALPLAGALGLAG